MSIFFNNKNGDDNTLMRISKKVATKFGEVALVTRSIRCQLFHDFFYDKVRRPFITKMLMVKSNSVQELFSKSEDYSLAKCHFHNISQHLRMIFVQGPPLIEGLDGLHIVTNKGQSSFLERWHVVGERGGHDLHDVANVNGSLNFALNGVTKLVLAKDVGSLEKIQRTFVVILIRDLAGVEIFNQQPHDRAVKVLDLDLARLAFFHVRVEHCLEKLKKANHLLVVKSNFTINSYLRFVDEYGLVSKNRFSILAFQVNHGLVIQDRRHCFHKEIVFLGQLER